MKVPFGWLKEYADIDLTPEELAAQLVKSGFEVEGIFPVAGALDKVLTCRITKISRHPDADRLQVCEITYGDRESVIVTAATNVFEGAVVPVATDGSTLFDGRKINAAPFRGVVSHGMFCSGQELGIDDSVIEGASVDGILILPPDTPLGVDIRDVLDLREVVLDISVTSNRPDCQSMVGIARETAAILGVPFRAPDLTYRTIDEETCGTLSVEVRATDLCPDYFGAVVKDVVIAPSPAWMRSRLRAVGIRSINNIVDITNYVLVEFGQPMHAFDLRRVRGHKIVVRRAEEGERLATLDEKVFALTPDALVIADAEGAIGLAGIMGGLDSEIRDDTTEIAFEAARFSRGNVRATSRRLGQRSASSARFERGVDIGTTTKGIERALALTDKLGCGKILRGKVGVANTSAQPRVLGVSAARIDALLGITVPDADKVRILEGLGIRTTARDGVLTCILPPEREDIEDYADIAEEIIRIYGYEHIVPTIPKVDGNVRHSYEERARKRCKYTLVGLGACEAMTYSFLPPDFCDKLRLAPDDPRRLFIRLENPIGEDMSAMRTTLAYGFLTAVERNLNRKNNAFRLFEISRVFLPHALPLAERPEEREHLALAAVGEKESFFTLKGMLAELAAAFGVKFGYTPSHEPFLHPGISADVSVKGKTVGWLGAVHPTVARAFGIDGHVYLAEIDFSALLALKPKQVRFSPLPRFQEIERDLAVTVDDAVRAGDMLRVIQRAGGGTLESVDVFDVYKGKQIEAGSKSIAFKLVFRAPDRTLTDDEVSAQMEKITAALAEKVGAKLR